MRTLVNQRVPRVGTHVCGDVYIETGVQNGQSMCEAAALNSPPFKALVGIEVDAEKAHQQRRRFSSDNRIHILDGSSLDVLPVILDQKSSTVFWLDAHYVGGDERSFDPRHGHNVLLGELALIMAVPWKTWPIILIDDSDTFCSNEFWKRGAAESGMDRAQNPTFPQIYDALGVMDLRYDLFISNHCIHCLPKE